MSTHFDAFHLAWHVLKPAWEEVLTPLSHQSVAPGPGGVLGAMAPKAKRARTAGAARASMEQHAAEYMEHSKQVKIQEIVEYLNKEEGLASEVC